MEKRLSLDGNSFLESLKEQFHIESQDIRSYSPLALAYIGDGVYELVIRSIIVGRANRSAENLHKSSVRFVKAETQARMVEALAEELTEEEKEVFRRGRNANSHTVAKNASRGDYRKATGFEALMGYLYLKGEFNRMTELVKSGIEKTGMEI